MATKKKLGKGFLSDKRVGSLGESYFRKKYEERLSKTAKSSLKFDVYIDENKKVEIKTDTYSLKETENFFFEKIANDKTFTLGGPWRAKQDRVDYFVYFFLQDKVFYWFKTSELCARLEKILKECKKVSLLNRNHRTIGFLVKRELLKDIYKEEKM